MYHSTLSVPILVHLLHRLSRRPSQVVTSAHLHLVWLIQVRPPLHHKVQPRVEAAKLVNSLLHQASGR